MRNFSFIIFFIILYFFGVGLFCFAEMNKPIWSSLFNMISNGLSVLLGYCALKRTLTQKEFQAIMFVFCYKIFCFIYLAIGYCTGNMKLLTENIFFICVIGVSGFLAWFLSNVFKKRKHELQTT